MSYRLEILAKNDEVRQYYVQRANMPGDAGVDLYCPEDVTIEGGKVAFVDLGIKCRMVDDVNQQEVSYLMYPRSSISKTPLMLANSIGLFDSSYRGSSIAALRNLSSEAYRIEKGSRLVQFVGPALGHIHVVLVDGLNETKRGEGGFGSTGK